MVRYFILGAWCWLGASFLVIDVRGEEALSLQLRRRVESSPGSGEYRVAVEAASWRPQQTAIVVCDMWDDHYCRASARRVAEMAPRMNEVISAARRKGVLIIHCPSGCMDQYEGSPQRELARQAPKVETRRPLEPWCYLDQTREPELPVDVSQPCDDETLRERIGRTERL
jgi:hypothetical protein